MIVGEFVELFDNATCFVIAIDSSKELPQDAILEQPFSAKSVRNMIIDRIAFFHEPVFVSRWSDCKADYNCEKACENVVVIFVHNIGDNPINLKLKSEIYTDIEAYCDKINAMHDYKNE